MIHELLDELKRRNNAQLHLSIVVNCATATCMARIGTTQRFRHVPTETLALDPKPDETILTALAMAIQDVYKREDAQRRSNDPPSVGLLRGEP